MYHNRLSDANIEYRQLFHFFFHYRTAALVIALVWSIQKTSSWHGFNVAIIVLGIIACYTAILYWRRHYFYSLVLKTPMLLSVDILISATLLVMFKSWDTPFFYYTVAPVLVASVLFRFKGAVFSSTILALGHLASLLVHEQGPVIKAATLHFNPIFGQVMAYYFIGIMCIYPADMIAEIARQRSIIKEKSEIEAVAEERLRISRELHDNLAQLLVAIKMHLYAISKKLDTDEEELEYVANLASKALVELRNSIFNLQPESMKQDLCGLLKDCCHRLAMSTSADIDHKLDVGNIYLSPCQRTEILRICQEAMANALNHSGTNKLIIKAVAQGQNLLIAVEDFGVGFSQDNTSSGMGLLNMRERARSLGGTIEITSSPGAGTRVQLVVPLDESCGGEFKALN